MQQLNSGIAQSLKKLGVQLLPFKLASNLQTNDIDFKKSLNNILKTEDSSSELNTFIKQALEQISDNIKLLKKQDENKNSTSPSDISLIQVFSVLNVVESITGDLSDIKTEGQLRKSLQENNISEKNIKLILNSLNEKLNLKESTLLTESVDSEFNYSKEIPSQKIAQNQIQKTINKISQQENNNILQEKLINGEGFSLQNNQQHHLKQNITQEEFTQNRETNETKAQPHIINQKENNSSKLKEMISLFKQANKNDKLTKKEEELITSTQENIKKIESTKVDLPSNLSDSKESKQISTNNSILLNEIKENSLKKENLKNERDNSFLTAQNSRPSKFKSIESKSILNNNESTIKNNLNLLNEKDKQSSEISDNKNQINASVEKIAEQNNFNNLINSKITSTSSKGTDLYKLAQQANVQNQINVAIKEMKNSGSQKLEIKLHPEELGSVSLELNITDKAIKGIISVESSDIAKHLAQNLKDISQSFKQSGFKVDRNDIVLQVSDEEPKQSRNKQNKRQKQQEIILDFNKNQSSLDINV